MRKLILLGIVAVLALSGCAYNSVIAARVCGDEVDATIDGTPLKISGKGINAIVVYQKYLTFEKGRQVPPLCDVYSSEKGEGALKDNAFSLQNKDVVTKQAVE
jgi:predicted GNAT family acetyltransferase